MFRFTHSLQVGAALAALLTVASCQEAGSRAKEATDGDAPVATTPPVDDAGTLVADAATAGPATVRFDGQTFDFGRVVAGEMVRHTYAFTNTGNTPLIIQNASASCGCTVPVWPKEPIAPGQTGEIKVEFNSAGREGQQSKTVTIVANTDPSQMQLLLTGEVLSEAQGPVRQ